MCLAVRKSHMNESQMNKIIHDLNHFPIFKILPSLPYGCLPGLRCTGVIKTWEQTVHKSELFLFANEVYRNSHTLTGYTRLCNVFTHSDVDSTHEMLNTWKNVECDSNTPHRPPPRCHTRSLLQGMFLDVWTHIAEHVLVKDINCCCRSRKAVLHTT